MRETGPIGQEPNGGNGDLFDAHRQLPLLRVNVPSAASSPDQRRTIGRANFRSYFRYSLPSRRDARLRSSAHQVNSPASPMTDRPRTLLATTTTHRRTPVPTHLNRPDRRFSGGVSIEGSCVISRFSNPAIRDRCEADLARYSGRGWRGVERGRCLAGIGSDPWGLPLWLHGLFPHRDVLDAFTRELSTRPVTPSFS